MVKYICDICGQEISTDIFIGYNELVTLEYEALRANGWNEWGLPRVKHVHKKCLNVPFDWEE